METDLTPYTATRTLTDKSALVLAPHADDEVFGCAGAILRHGIAGARVSVVILTDGSAGGESETRRAESIAAAKVLGYGSPEFWGIQDRELRYTEQLVLRVLTQLERVKADVLYAPSPWEVHPDHRQTMSVAVEAVRRARVPVKLMFYEIGAPLQPNLLVDISDLKEAKQSAMQCFASQLARQDYARHIAALNTYRTYTLPSDVSAAEAFHEVTPAQLAQGWNPGALALHTSQPVSQSVTAANLPLVSVMVRSMDIDLLAEALDSVAIQTYPNIEVIVVSAVEAHRPLPEKCGPFPLRLITEGEKLARSKAANVALARATGDFLLFLDDDDWLMPGHIARLVDALRRYPSSPAAYTGISLVDATGKQASQVFDLPFDAVRQQAGNLTPIHAVLFRASARDMGVRFDEKLDRLEDWDFWLQISRQGNMVHVPGVSAAYRIHHSSGVHTDAGPMGAATARIYEKWSALWSPEQCTGLMQRVWSHTDLEAQLASATQQATVLEEKIQRQQEQISDKELQLDRLKIAIAQKAASITRLNHDLEALKNSTIWRLTAPIRAIINGIKRLAQVGYAQPSAPEIKPPQGSAEGFVETHTVSEDAADHYPAWIARFDTPDAMQLSQWRSAIHAWPSRPLLSVVMPVFNPEPEFLKAAIESVRGQIYPHWELCIADDASTDPSIWSLINEYAQVDSRIKAIRRESNGHISKASNSALQLATGEFIALMDNDDVLSPHALFFVAQTILNSPGLQIVYSDEDKLDAHGRRFDPYFKPDWNYTLFLGQNFVSHLGVYRTTLVHAVGGFREGFEGSQDYDLTLRCIERVQNEEICHIPRVLYHWRVTEGSTSSGKDAKPYAVLAARRAIEEHRTRVKLPCEVEVLPIQYCRCLPSKEVSLNQVALIVIRKSDGSQTHPDSGWWSKEAFNFGGVAFSDGAMESIHSIVTASNCPLVCIVQDGVTPAGYIDVRRMVQTAMEPQNGLVAGTLRDRAMRLVSGGLVLTGSASAAVMLRGLHDWDHGYMGRGALAQELSAVSLNCVVAPKGIFGALAEVSSNWSPNIVNTIEICRRVRQLDMRVIWRPDSTWTGIEEEDDICIHEGIRSTDPFYHPALDPIKADFSLLFPE